MLNPVAAYNRVALGIIEFRWGWNLCQLIQFFLEGSVRQKDLVALANQPVIPPNEKKFYPAVESLRWREKRLSAKY